MMVQEIYIKRAKWRVTIYHEADESCADEILDKLMSLGCRGGNLANAERLLLSGVKDEGITYSNIEDRETVMVIEATSSGREYWNSLDHEKLHLLQDIALTDGIDPFGEEIAYISGELIREVYSKAKDLLCDCCRENGNRKNGYKKYIVYS